MAKLNPILRAATVAHAIYAAHERRADDWRRPHLGASLIGHKCDRHLWLTFRWALAPQHDGQQLRLFARGDREEQWVIEDLRSAGIGIYVQDRNPATGDQWLVSWGHFGGHLDAIVGNVPGLPAGKRAVLEVKSHNRKSFDRLLEKGLRSAKPEHWAQCQVYMHGMLLSWSLYIAVCKDDDRIEALLIPIDEKAAAEFVERGRAICALDGPPAKMDKDYPPCVYTSADGTRWPCDHYDLCHGSAVPVKNCRTCASCEVTALDDITDGLANCAHIGRSLTVNQQKMGCNAHLTIPAMHNAQVVSVDEIARRITYQRADGTTFVDGGTS